MDSYMTIIGLDDGNVSIVMDDIVNIFEIVREKNITIWQPCWRKFFHIRDAEEMRNYCTDDLIDAIFYIVNEYYMEYTPSTINHLMIILKDIEDDTPYLGITAFFFPEQDKFYWYVFDMDDTVDDVDDCLKYDDDCFEYDFGFLGDEDE